MGNMLVIIGNGFDLAHKYHTGSSDFKKSIDTSPFKEFEEKHLDVDWTDASSAQWWHDYEKRVGENLYKIQSSIDLKYDTSQYSWDEFLTMVNRLYDTLQERIMSYLKNEYNSNDAASKVKLPSIKNLVRHRGKTSIITFNHTDTVKRYGMNAFFIHGSLAENYIVFGYDHINPMTDFRECDLGDIDEWKIIKRNKRYQRIMLEFRRYCQKKNVADDDSRKGQEMLELYLEHRACDLSGKLFPYSTDNASYQLVLRFIRETGIDLKNGLLPIIPYRKIRTIAILGHSLKMDQRLIDEIVSKCINVRKIVIFRYETESDSHWNEKVDYFKRLSIFKRHRKKRNRIRFVQQYY